MKRKWIAALLAGCMLAALLLTGCSAAETVKRLRFGVAGEGGVYHNFGEQFAALENETSNGTIELRTTAGSAANLRLLTGEYLQLAIAQDSTIIRRGVKLDNLVQIAHNVEVGENTVMAAQVGIAGSVKIGSHCMFGGQAGLSGHILSLIHI